VEHVGEKVLTAPVRQRVHQILCLLANVTGL